MKLGGGKLLTAWEHLTNREQETWERTAEQAREFMDDENDY